ncbi:MAG: fasciclin domain-containing protein [Pseudomonadota bacterium]
MSTVFETLAADKAFSILVSLVLSVDETLDAGLVETLEDPDFGSTLFAPTNDAFVAMANDFGCTAQDEEGATSYLLAAASALNEGDAGGFLADILLYHVTSPELEDTDLGSGQVLKTLADVDLKVFNGALVDADPDNPNAALGEIETTENGVIIPIDQVLLPLDIQVGDDGDEESEAETDLDALHLVESDEIAGDARAGDESAPDGANAAPGFDTQEEPQAGVLGSSDITEDEIIRLLLSQGEGGDGLLVSSVNEKWRVLIEDAEELGDDDIFFI